MSETRTSTEDDSIFLTTNTEMSYHGHELDQLSQSSRFARFSPYRSDKIPYRGIRLTCAVASTLQGSGNVGIMSGPAEVEAQPGEAGATSQGGSAVGLSWEEGGYNIAGAGPGQGYAKSGQWSEERRRFDGRSAAVGAAGGAGATVGAAGLTACCCGCVIL